MYSISPKICTELTVILGCLPNSEKQLIPTDFMEYLTVNKDNEYEFVFHAEMPFDGQNISVETKAIIVSLFKKFFSTSRLNEEIDFLIKRNSHNSET